MKLFEGKTKSERNKTIAAIILGGSCLIVLFFAFGRGIFGGSSSTAKAKPSPSPKTQTSGSTDPSKLQMPSIQQQNLEMMSLPIVYNPNIYGTPDPGRNIFAFYEPPKPTPYVPTPEPIRTPIPATPPPPPPIQIAGVNPGSAYAGSNGFRLDIAGDKFTPDTKVYFEQQEIPATFINEQRMTADIPSVLIRNGGGRTIIAQNADGTKTSNPVTFDVQPPPKPGFQYIGMIARKRGNNDTAYFMEGGKQLPTSARLNEVVGGRFRVISISESEAILEDVQLSFSKHRLPLQAPPATTISNPSQPGRPTRGGFPTRDGFTPANPGMPPGATNTRIPGIPDNIPRYVPPTSNSNRPVRRDNDDDDEDGN